MFGLTNVYDAVSRQLIQEKVLYRKYYSAVTLYNRNNNLKYKSISLEFADPNFFDYANYDIVALEDFCIDYYSSFGISVDISLDKILRFFKKKILPTLKNNARNEDNVRGNYLFESSWLNNSIFIEIDYNTLISRLNSNFKFALVNKKNMWISQYITKASVYDGCEEDDNIYNCSVEEIEKTFKKHLLSFYITQNSKLTFCHKNYKDGKNLYITTIVQVKWLKRKNPSVSLIKSFR